MKTFTPILTACVVALIEFDAVAYANDSSYTYTEPVYVNRPTCYNDDGVVVFFPVPWVMNTMYEPFIPYYIFDKEGDPLPPSLRKHCNEKARDPEGWKYYLHEWMQLRELRNEPPEYYFDEDFGSNGGVSLG